LGTAVKEGVQFILPTIKKKIFMLVYMSLSIQARGRPTWRYHCAVRK